MRLYISGPMRGVPEWNFPAFDQAAAFVRSLGWEAINPADHDREVNPDYESLPEYALGEPTADVERLLGWDLQQIAGPECDGIVLLPGWENSVGAGHELYVAKATGKKVFHLKEGWTGDGEFVMVLEEHIEVPPVIVGLMGYAQVGKDTVANILVEEHGFERVAFADALREMLYALNPQVYVRPGGRVIGYHDFVQPIVDAFGWEYAKANTDVRELLQRLGTEAGRNVLGDSIWVDTAMQKIKPGGRYVITDVRFPNEAQAIRHEGGRLWRVRRPGYVPVNGHASETACDDVEADAVIENAWSIEFLAAQVSYLAVGS